MTPRSDTGRVAKTRPEVALLLCCARTRIDSETVERIGRLLREGLDWPYLTRAALQHGSLPLLCWNLSHHCPEAVPSDRMDQLRIHFHTNAQRNLALSRELLQLLKQLEENGIPVMPYKGPALAAALYGDLLLRQCSDLDILVRREDVRRATELLAARGFHPKRQLTRAGEAAMLRTEYARSFVRTCDRFVLELHWTIRPRYCAFRIDPERFWAAHQWISVAGRHMRSLAPNDLLLVLCAHASWHLWGRLQWISDVAELIRVHGGEMDWQQVLCQAQALGSRRMLLLGLFLAADLLGAALPEVIVRQIQADPVVRSLAAFVSERLLNDTREQSPTQAKMAERAYLLHMRERWPDRLGYCLHLARDVIPPSQAERTVLPLPALLSPLYYLLRPVRLVGKYGPMLLNRWR